MGRSRAAAAFAAVVVSLFISQGPQAAPDDCSDLGASPESAIRSCSLLIASQDGQSSEVASAYQHRAYAYLRAGDRDRALADLAESLRRSQQRGVFGFFEDNWRALMTVFVPVAFVALGWYLTYRTAVRLERQKNANTIELEQKKYLNTVDLDLRKDNLERVNEQIKNVYGPLNAQCAAWRVARIKLWEAAGIPFGEEFFHKTARTPQQMRMWRLWREKVFMPILNNMESIIVNQCHLIDPDDYDASTSRVKTLPEHFLKLLEHVESYRGVIENWRDVLNEDARKGTDEINAWRDTARGRRPIVPHYATENFPKEFSEKVRKRLLSLEEVQKELIAKLKDAPKFS